MVFKVIIELSYYKENRYDRSIFVNGQLIVIDSSNKNCSLWKHHIRNTWHILKDKTDIDEEVYQYLINNPHV